jgi:hypothetical protein
MGNMIEVTGGLLAHAVDMGHDLDNEKGLPAAGNQVETPWPHRETFRDPESSHEEYGDDHLEEAIL